MTGNRTQAERALAVVIHEIRDDWDAAGVVVALRHLSDRPMAEVSAAAIYCATKRLDQRTPDCIRQTGEHERALANLTGQTSAAPKPSYLTEERCPHHGQTLPCLACQRDPDARPADPAEIAAMREAIRAAREKTTETEGDHHE